MSRPPAIQIPKPENSLNKAARKVRGRSNSIVKVEQVGDRTQEELLDQSTYPNINANWVNSKGAWLIHVVLICIGKIIIDTLPGMSQQISWTLVNIFYLAISYLMFHWVTGMPFEYTMHAGAYDELTLWEQIDDGAQYTPAKKWLFSVPVILFLASTHYTNYNPWLFAVNLTALILVIIPKLPQLHRQRLRFMPDESSGVVTPSSASFPPSRVTTPSIESRKDFSQVTEKDFLARRY